jgi:LmbE family N-acetylglucosaminyl deacetylase
MNKKILIGIICIFIILLITFSFHEKYNKFLNNSTMQFSEVELLQQDRILILAPHPDDEILGCAGIIQKAIEMNLSLHIVFFTYGDANEWSFLLYRKSPVITQKGVENMGLIRYDEALAADKILGVSKDNITFLGYPDFGTLNIWYTHWGNNPPYESLLTRVTKVPYLNAMRPGAEYRGEEILRDLETIFLNFKPTKIFVSHPADDNPDHRALYLFTQIAIWDLETEISPKLYPYLIHYYNWPKDRGYYPNNSLDPPEHLQRNITWTTCLLSPKEIVQKDMALMAHQTQYQSNKEYLTSFVRTNELFSDFAILKLGSNLSRDIYSHAKGLHLEVPEELNSTERSLFVSVEDLSVRLQDDNLLIEIEFSRPLLEDVEASIHLFGYKEDFPFAQMPKLNIILGAFDYAIFDKESELTHSKIRILRQPMKTEISIPLDELENPQLILIGSRTYLDSVPLYWHPWRIFKISTMNQK